MPLGFLIIIKHLNEVKIATCTVLFKLSVPQVAKTNADEYFLCIGCCRVYDELMCIVVAGWFTV